MSLKIVLVGILEKGVGSGVNHKHVMKENLSEHTERQNCLHLRLCWLRCCATPTGPVTLLSLHPGCLFCAELNPSYFHKPKHVSKMVCVALLGKSDVVIC